MGERAAAVGEEGAVKEGETIGEATVEGVAEEAVAMATEAEPMANSAVDTVAVAAGGTTPTPSTSLMRAHSQALGAHSCSILRDRRP